MPSRGGSLSTLLRSDGSVPAPVSPGVVWSHPQLLDGRPRVRVLRSEFIHGAGIPSRGLHEFRSGYLLGINSRESSLPRSQPSHSLLQTVRAFGLTFAQAVNRTIGRRYSRGRPAKLFAAALSGVVDYASGWRT